MRSLISILFLIGSLTWGCAAADMSPSLNQVPSRIDTLAPIVTRADPAKEYNVIPKDGKDEGKLNQTEGFIKAVVKIDSVFSYRDSEKALRLWTFNATQSQIDEIKKNEGVEEVEENIIDGKFHAVLPLPTDAAFHPGSANPKVKRALEFSTQTAPIASDLIMVSQPTTVPNLSDLENYVYEKHGGAGVYIYHVEVGMAARKTEEFPPEQVEFLRGKYAEKNNLPENEDGGAPGNSHSTCVASKTIGQTYGSAKKATLVSVKMEGLYRAGIRTIFDEVWQHIKGKNRQKKSIVTMSFGSKDPIEARNVVGAWDRARQDMANLMKNDVIILASAGNDALKDDGKGGKRTNADTVPDVFEGPDFPLIVVGATDFTGAPADFSQGGDHVKILGPGKDIKCLDRSLRQPWTTSGTSFSTPLIAGVLATFLGYETIPFDMSDGKVAANAKQYLTETANWERQQGVKTIWNLVTVENNPKKGGAQGKQQPSVITPSCTTVRRSGLHVDYHIQIRGMTGDVIKDGGEELCKQQAGCGAFNSWKWVWTNHAMTEASVTFNQPLGMKGGCVERAFMSAAKGPQIAKCASE